ncbi:MAG: serine/threonine protein kinase [Planctomycetes bacterium]|nr:serine/threonine protein kinase [Planctomycetota bacterium]
MSSRGQTIGPYRLLTMLGEGGFGEVWLAERREPIVQRVAIKIIKPGMDSRAVIARFEQERQALAMMDHPNVARVFDAGTTPQGRPYFVMEYVSGESITEYCDRNRMTLRDRLVLFKTVCDAVQHAHLKGIIHRDLKPSNILIETIDQRPVAKVIDFGVAKAMSGSLTEMTVYTEVGQVIGTPEYMSPEQAEVGGRDVDTRSDIYSLGVVLYELLTGFKPFDSQTLRDKGYDEIRRIIREVDPPRPSTRILTWTGRRASPQTSALAHEIAKCRRIEPPELVHALRRELEWIPLRAMRKERTERYLTPVALAEDIQRYLDGQPLQAGPDSASYKARKFIRRNRAPAVAAALLLLILILGFAGTAWGWRRAASESRAARRAEAQAKAAEADSQRRRQQAESTLKFLTGVLQDSNAVQNRGTGFTVREMLDIAGKRIGTEFKGNPEGRIAVQSVVAEAYANLGLDGEAIPYHEDALRTALDVYGPESETVANIKFRLACSMASLPGHEDLVPKVEALLQESVALSRKLYGESDPRTSRMTGMLSQFYANAGNSDKQESFYIESLRLLPNNWGKTPQQLHEEIEKVVKLANDQGARGEWEPAQKTLLDYSQSYFAFPGMRSNFPDSTAILAGALAERGYKFAGRAAALLALKVADEEYRDRPESVAVTRFFAAQSLNKCGYKQEAVDLLDRWLEFQRQAMLKDSVGMIAILATGGTEYGRAEQFETAEKLHLESIRLAEGQDAAARVNAALRYAGTLRGQGKIDDAVRVATGAYDAAASALGIRSKQAKSAAQFLETLAKARSDAAGIRKWSARAQGKEEPGSNLTPSR